MSYRSSGISRIMSTPSASSCQNASASRAPGNRHASPTIAIGSFAVNVTTGSDWAGARSVRPRTSVTRYSAASDRRGWSMAMVTGSCLPSPRSSRRCSSTAISESMPRSKNPASSRISAGIDPRHLARRRCGGTPAPVACAAVRGRLQARRSTVSPSTTVANRARSRAARARCWPAMNACARAVGTARSGSSRSGPPFRVVPTT